MSGWLVKSEPFVYAWDQLVKDGKTCWDGVRNYQARNYLLQMRKGDEVFFYHSNEGLSIVGIARVCREAYPDPGADDPRWVAVDLIPWRALPRPVSLSQMKADPRLKDMALLRQSRLSVSPVREAEWKAILELAGCQENV